MYNIGSKPLLRKYIETMEIILRVLFQKYSFHIKSVWCQTKVFFPNTIDSDGKMSHFCFPDDLQNR